jgi:hypothetical protein
VCRFNLPELPQGARQMAAAHALPEMLRRGVQLLLDMGWLLRLTKEDFLCTISSSSELHSNLIAHRDFR